MNRSFINGIMNRKNKSFRIKNRHSIIEQKLPDFENNPARLIFEEIITGRELVSSHAQYKRKALGFYR